MRLKEQINKLRQANLWRKVKHTKVQKNKKKKKKTTADKPDSTTGRNKSKDIGEIKETQQTGSNNTNKTEPYKITKENSTKLVESSQRTEMLNGLITWKQNYKNLKKAPRWTYTKNHKTTFCT